VRLEIRRPTGPSCGNLGYQGHNSNRTFRSNPGINVSSSVANGTTVPNFGQNMTWTWTGSVTRDAGVSPTTESYVVTSINVAEGVWYWKNRATGLTTSSAIGKDYTGSSVVTAWGANAAPFYNFLDEDGGQYVKFCCEDLTTAGADVDRDGILDTMFHQVILRVWDDGNKDGCIGCWVLPTTADPYPRQDNYNDTWANVKVDNKVPPVLTCPPNITISCEAPITTSTTTWLPATPSVLTFTGVPTAWSACGVPAVEYKDVVSLNQCKSGTVTRTFRIVGNPGVNCTQIITVSSNYNSTVVWSFLGSWLSSPGSTSASSKRWNSYTPNKICGVQANGASTDITDPNVYINYGLKVLETTNCDGPTETELRDGRPFYVQGPCDVIGVNTAVERYDFEDGVCRKWVVTYTFMNWCNNYCVRFKQDWVFKDVIAPVIACAPRPIFQQQAECTTNITLKKSATDLGGCTVAAPATSAWLKWEVFVDAWGDGTWDYAYSSFRTNITSNGGFADVTYGGISSSTNPAGTIPTKYLAPTVPGDDATIDFRYPITGKYSHHKILWRVYDGCHNSTQCIEEIEVKDLKPPTPYCIHLSTALMQVPVGAPAGSAPMVEIWARDFDRGSTDFCTAQQDLKFTFNNWLPNADRIYSEHYFDAAGKGYDITASNTIKYNAGEYQRWLPSQKSSSMIFTKANLPGVTLKMSVIDWNNNVDYCSVDLRLVCNDPINCPPSAGSRIAGTVKTAGDQPVNNVTVTIDANITEYPVSVMTPATGSFEKTVPSGLDYEVTASKGGDYINGVSTLDLVMIQRHILGIQTFDSPYKLIAADATNDGIVTAADLTELRKLILGITNELPNNASWRFPVSSQTMDASNPFPFMEKIAIASISVDKMDQNFVAVKIGDVNGNVSTNVANPAVEGRSNKTVAMAVAEQAIAAGDVVEIPVTAANFNDVAGFQYTMNLKGASLVGINSGALEMTDNNIGVIAKDVVTMSYAANNGVTVSSNEVLFTLVVKADRAVKVSEMLSIGSAVTPAESYTSDFAVGKVSLEVRTAPVTAIALMQNEPNPFKGQTTVSFLMPDAAAASLSVYDVTGKVVSVRNIQANKGLNSEIFTREQLGASGVMYYTLKSGEFTATRKMIIID
jgi:hypothetical protein